MIVAGLVLAAIITLTFLDKAVNDLKGETLEKNYIARDIALALDAVYAAPGDIEYTYSMRDYKYVVEIRDNMVRVRKNLGESDNVAGVYDYFGSNREGSKMAYRIIPSPGSEAPALVHLGNRDGNLFVMADNAAVERNAAFA